MKTALPTLPRLDLLNDIRIASPCRASWDKMKGNDQVRHCDQCRQSVYNLSEMTAAEAVQLIQEHDGRLCVQLYRRPDGTVITTDCPGGLRWKIWKWLGRRRAWIAALFAILVLPACGGMQYQSRDLLLTQTPPKTDPGDEKAQTPTEPNKSAAASFGVPNAD